MKREKENQIILAKEKDMDDQFFINFGQLSFPLQYRSLQFFCLIMYSTCNHRG